MLVTVFNKAMQTACVLYFYCNERIQIVFDRHFNYSPYTAKRQSSTLIQIHTIS